MNAKTKCLHGLWGVVRNEMNRESGKSIENITRAYHTLNHAAEAINDELLKHFSDPPDWTSVLDSLAVHDDSEWQVSVEVGDVLKMLQQLKPRKAAGSDGLPSRFLKAAANELAGPLAHLIALSIETRMVPAAWKLGHVIPVPKCNSPTLSDLRPLSMLPIFSKVLERVVLKSVQTKLINMYGENQFGFRPKSSTLHAHISVHDYITRVLDSTSAVGVVMVSYDMSKAFDRLKHDCLLNSLKDGSLPTPFLNWCISFLMDRRQCVRINHCISLPRCVTSGIPQGSVLAPYFFAAHIGSWRTDDAHSIIIKFADDVLRLTVLYGDEDAQKLMRDGVTEVKDWCATNGLVLNQDKTKCMLVMKPRLKLISPAYDVLKELKILGVTYESNLSWDSHIDDVCKKANRRLYILRKMKYKVSKEDLIKIYNAIILGTLEYASPLFVGMKLKLKQKIERVRKRCHRIICRHECKCDLLPEIQQRRKHSLKIFKEMTESSHILHHLLPPMLPRTLHFSMPQC